MAERGWFYTHNEQTLGPVSKEQLQRLAAGGELHLNDLLWEEGSGRRTAIMAMFVLDISAGAGADETPLAAVPEVPAFDWQNLVDERQPSAEAPGEQAEELQAEAIAGETPPLAEVIESETDAAPALEREAFEHSLDSVDFEAPLPMAEIVPPSPEEMGFDPDTGQILNPERYNQWQKEQQGQLGQPVETPRPAPTASVQEIFLKARTELEAWIDLNKNRQRLINGQIDAIRTDPELVQFMREQSLHGQKLVERLRQHFNFLIDNRRKFYAAYGREG